MTNKPKPGLDETFRAIQGLQADSSEERQAAIEVLDAWREHVIGTESNRNREELLN